MRKLKLESLQVESFETAPSMRERGTMYAHDGRPPRTDAGCVSDTHWVDCTYSCSTQVECETDYCETVYCETLGCETNGCETVYCDTSYCG
jgi:hypothetical protein